MSKETEKATTAYFDDVAKLPELQNEHILNDGLRFGTTAILEILQGLPPDEDGVRSAEAHVPELHDRRVIVAHKEMDGRPLYFLAVSSFMQPSPDGPLDSWTWNWAPKPLRKKNIHNPENGKAETSSGFNGTDAVIICKSADKLRSYFEDNGY